MLTSCMKRACFVPSPETLLPEPGIHSNVRLRGHGHLLRRHRVSDVRTPVPGATGGLSLIVVFFDLSPCYTFL